MPREHEFSRFTQIAVWALVAVGFGAAILNIAHGDVSHPGAFWIVLGGFFLFATAKFSMFRKGRWISFGTATMSENMANVYRLGSWLMAVGILATFV
ncbi:MAG: hypothetical protein KIT14_07395 [bacterium]|nr:hypothetical protein [bacterium]